MEERIERLAQEARAVGLDAYVATSDESIAYLTGFRPLQLERFFAVAVNADGSGGALVVPALDRGQVSEAPGGLSLVSYGAASDGLPELAAALGRRRRVGVEESHVSFARARAFHDLGLEPTPAESVLLGLRARKDASEVERIRQACVLVEESLTALFESLRVGTTEREANARTESLLRARGATDTHPLILFGESAANPHAQATSRALTRGDVVCADVSACLDGYWGDLSRCATAGPASDWAQETWSLVRAAQVEAIDACRPGTPVSAVDRAQRRRLEERSDLGECLHGAGHAIGLAIHEPPFLVPRYDTPLEPGMTLTIEPGLYRRGVGGVRLEDDVLVGEDEPLVLSSLPLDLVELAA